MVHNVGKNMTEDDSDNKTGEVTGYDVSDSAFVDAINELGTAGTDTVRRYIKQEEGWDAHRTSIYRRLEGLVDEGKLTYWEEGGSKKWMLPGKFEEEVSDWLFKEATEETGGMATVEEVAEKVGCDRNSAVRRLQKLENEDKIVSKRTNSGNSIWALK